LRRCIATDRIRVQPSDLLGVLWVQVAQLAEADIGHRACAAPGCLTWFVVAPGTGHRSDKTTCSDRCRKQLERAPKRRRSA
jgi:hypothetical protein